MKELIEQELLRRGYQIVKWFKIYDSWMISVMKDDKRYPLEANQIMDDLLERELR